MQGAPETFDEIGAWLKHRGDWNSKRTIARVSIFSTPAHVIFSHAQAIQFSNEESSVDGVESTAVVPSQNGLTCRACGLLFNEVCEQQLHFKSEIHRTNLQRRLRGLGPVDVCDSGKGGEACDGGQADDVEDISDDEEEDIESTIETEFDIESSINVDSTISLSEAFDVRDGVSLKSFSHNEGQSFVFASKIHPQWEIAVSPVVLANNLAKENPWKALYLVIHEMTVNSTMWAVMILRSGRFAGAIFDGVKVIVHKAFRRYTIRAKAGGGQSSHDNQSGKAQSAGATLRRYGEQALKEDVSNLLHDWTAHFQTCSKILIAVPKTMRNLIFEDSRDAPLRRDDPRVRAVPFMVGKPTFEEVQRVHERCSTVVFRLARAESAHVSFSDDVIDGDVAVEGGKSKGTQQGDDSEILTGVAGRREEAGGSSTNNPAPTAQSLVAAAVGVRDEELKALLLLDEIPFSRDFFGTCREGDVDRLREVLQRCAAAASASPRTPTSNQDTHNGNGSPRDHDATLSQRVQPQVGDESMASASAGEGTGEAVGDVGVTTHSLKASHEVQLLINSFDSLESMSTGLHIAAERGHGALVSVLLEVGADPTKIDVRGRPPFFLAKDKPARDAFRRYRGGAEEEWDWEAAGVPAALTKELEDAQKEKEKEKKRRAKQRKKNEKEREEEEQKLRLKEMKEAEARKKEEEVRRKDSAGLCAACAKPLFGLKALDVLDKRCCSSPCVLVVRRKLAAEAALQRLAPKPSASAP